MGFSPFDEITIYNFFCEFNGPGAGAGSQNFFTDSPRPRRIDAVMARNPDSIDHTLRFTSTTDGDGVTLGEVIVPAGAGVGAVPPVDCLTPIAPPQLGAFILPVNSSFSVAIGVNITDSVELDVIATVGEF